MTYQTAKEAKLKHISVMGRELGEQYSALWQQLAYLNYEWSEYVVIFGTNSERVNLFNKSTPEFASLIQDKLWDSILLGIARITDPPQIGKRINLTILNLPNLVNDPSLKTIVANRVTDAQAATDFCRTWRNRRLAHTDLDSVLERHATPLMGASRNQVKDGLAALASVLNSVQMHYFQSETKFDASLGRGALSLLHVLHDGLRARDEKIQRIKSRTYSEDDLSRPDI